MTSTLIAFSHTEPATERRLSRIQGDVKAIQQPSHTHLLSDTAGTNHQRYVPRGVRMCLLLRLLEVQYFLQWPLFERSVADCCIHV
jgi:hypothetical protein